MRTKLAILIAVVILMAALLACPSWAPSGFPYEADPTEAPQAMVLP